MSRPTRTAVVAAALSLVAPGAGQLYVGARRRALVLLGVWAAVCVTAAALFVLAPADAALAAVASTLGLLEGLRERAGEALLEHTGQVRWLVETVVEEVDRAITRGQAMRGAVSFADGTPG